MLFEPIKLGNLEIKNRIMMAPMCMFVAKNGIADDFHFTHYTARAMGGVGLIVMEATGVEESGKITNNCLGLYRDDQIDGLRNIVLSAKKYGTKMGIQLGHAGRKCTASVDKIYAPSPIPFDDKSKMPTEMTHADIKRVVDAFGKSAERAKSAGFDLIEIHAAHGYLLSSFLSPLSNERTDEYGGSPENRVRFLKEVIAAVKANFDGTLTVRVSAEDYVAAGNRPKDVAAMLNLIKSDIVAVNVSSGGVVDAPISLYSGYQLDFAHTIKELTGLPVIAGGLLTQPEHLEEIVHSGRADMVFVARELLRNPNFALRAAYELDAKLDWPYLSGGRGYK